MRIPGPQPDTGPARAPALSTDWMGAAVALALLVGTGVPTIWYLRAVVGNQARFTSLLPGSVPLFVAASVVVVGLLWLLVVRGTPYRLPAAAVEVLLWLVVLLMVGWYVAFEPTWSPGSDNADALHRGASQLAHLRDPYAVTSKFGGPLSPMLGGFVLAIPFLALFGGLYLQTLFWFVGGVCAFRYVAGARAALVAAAVFAFSPWSRMALPSQSDNWITAAGVVASGSLGAWLLGRSGTSRWLLLGSAVLYGVALAYRFILWPTVLPLLVVLVRRHGWRRALAWLVPAGVTTVVLVLLPFAVDARNYLDGPIAMGLQKGVRGDFPHAGLFVVAVTVLVTVLASARVRTLAGAWGAAGAGMTAMLLAVAVTKWTLGPVAMISHYDTVAFSGAVLVFGVTWLALRGVTEDRRDDEEAGGAVSSAGRGRPGLPS